jgi:phage gp46-like protein
MSSSASFYITAATGESVGAGTREPDRNVRRWIDPKTRDYVVENGDLKQDYGFTSQVVIALATRLGSCLVMPNLGSRIHEVRRADEQGRMLAEKHAVQALQHLSSRFKDLVATASISTERPGAIDLQISGKRGQVELSMKYTASVSSS